MKLKIVQNRVRSQPFLRKGMSAVMSDGWTGTVHSVSGDFVSFDEDGGDPLLDYRAVNLSAVKFTRGSVTVNWKASRSNNTRNTRKGSTPIVSEQRRAVVVDLNRARLEREWKDAPLD